MNVAQENPKEVKEIKSVSVITHSVANSAAPCPGLTYPSPSCRETKFHHLAVSLTQCYIPSEQVQWVTDERTHRPSPSHQIETTLKGRHNSGSPSESSWGLGCKHAIGQLLPLVTSTLNSLQVCLLKTFPGKHSAWNSPSCNIFPGTQSNTDILKEVKWLPKKLGEN